MNGAPRLSNLAKRLVFTIDHLVGLPPPSPPLEFTRRVILQQAHLRCALSEVSESDNDGLVLPPCFSSRGSSSCSEGNLNRSDCDGGESQPPSWCRYRADVRLVNLEVCMKKKLVGLAEGQQQQPQQKVETASTENPENSAFTSEVVNDANTNDAPTHHVHDTEMSLNSGKLEILVPSHYPPPRPKGRPYMSRSVDRWRGAGSAAAATPAATTEADHRRKRFNGGGVRSDTRRRPSSVNHMGPAPTVGDASSQAKRRQTWPQRPGAALAVAAAAVASAGKIPEGRGETSVSSEASSTSEEKSEAGQGDEKIEGDSSESSATESDDGVDQGIPRRDDAVMTKIIDIDSLSYRRSLEWCSRRLTADAKRNSADGPDARGLPAEVLTAGKRAGESRRTSSSCSQSAMIETERFSQMGIEIRTGDVMISLPPAYQLGNLQVAAIVQWKGIQAALGEKGFRDVRGRVVGRS